MYSRLFTGQKALNMELFESCQNLQSTNESILALIEKKADVNYVNNGGSTALYSAILSGHIEAIKTLIEHKANLVDLSGMNYLSLVPGAKHKQCKITITKLLIEKGAEVNKKGQHDSYMPIFNYVIYNLPEGLKLLIDAKANPMIKNLSGLTCLMFAKDLDMQACVQFLEDHFKSENLKRDNEISAALQEDNLLIQDLIKMVQSYLPKIGEEIDELESVNTSSVVPRSNR